MLWGTPKLWQLFSLLFCTETTMNVHTHHSVIDHQQMRAWKYYEKFLFKRKLVFHACKSHILHHHDGVMWHNAPVPRKWIRNQTQFLLSVPTNEQSIASVKTLLLPTRPTSLSSQHLYCSQNRTIKLSGCNRLHYLDMHHEYVYRGFFNLFM